MKYWAGMRALTGWTICLLSSFFVVAAIGDLVKGDGKTSPSVLVALLVFFSGTAFAGFRLARSGSQKAAEAAARQAALEDQRLLNAADANGGRLSLAEAAAHSGLSVARCKELLKRLTAEGAAEVEFDPDGNVLYHFPGLGRPDPPASAPRG